MTTRMLALCSGFLSAALLGSAAFAQPLPPLSVCNTETKAPACNAVRGDRTEGWKAQTRVEPGPGCDHLGQETFEAHELRAHP